MDKKALIKNFGIFIVLSVILSIIFYALFVSAQSTVNFGTANNFSVLAGSEITNIGNTIIVGDIGSYPTTTINGFPPGIINGTNHAGDAVTQEAKTNLTAVYDDIAGRTPASTVASELGGTTKTPGIYDSSGGTFGITGNLTLDAQGNSSAVFIFQAASTLITASNSNVFLINGTRARNVFWQVGTSATLGADSTFKGNILALTSVTLNTGANVSGRVLARNGAVALNTNEIIIDICTPDMTYTGWSDWTNLTCISTQRNQSRLRINYDSNTCEEAGYLNWTEYEYQLVSEYQNTTQTAWTNLSCLSNNKMNQTANWTQFDIYGCGMNTTFFNYTQELDCDFCSYNIENSSWSVWQNQGICLINDSQLQNRSKIEYDSNYSSCYLITNLSTDLWNSGNNNTYWEYNSTSCDFCTPDMTYTDWSDWTNLTCSLIQMNQSRERINYDSNACEEGGYLNWTEYEYQLTGPTYQNTTQTSWENVSCLINDKMNQTANWTQFDIYGCGTNTTFFNYTQELDCDFCSYNITNSSWTAWQNQTSCRTNNTKLQNQSKVEYDSNYSTCYAITGLSSDLFVNITYWNFNETKCDYDGNPKVSIISPLNQSYNNATLMVNISVTDSDISLIWFDWNGTNVTYTTSAYVTFNEGNNSLIAYANDTFGNINKTEARTFSVDTTLPVLSDTSVTKTNTTADIFFAVSENVNTTLNYSTSTSLGIVSIIAESDSGTFSLTGLDAKTTYYYNLTLCDAVENCVTNGTFSFTTDTTPETSDSRTTGSPQYGTYTLNQSQLDAGYTRDFGVRGGIRFMFKGEWHTGKIIAITVDSVTIELMSEPQNATIKIGQEAKFDINNDNVYYLSVKLNSTNIAYKTANVLFKSINEKIPTNVESVNSSITSPVETEEKTTTEKIIKDMKGKMWMNIAGIILLIALIIYWVVIYARRKKHARGYHIKSSKKH